VSSFNRRVTVDEEVGGAALSIAAMCITLGASMGIVLYYPSLEAYALINLLRIVVNVVGVFYLFELVFAGKFT